MALPAPVLTICDGHKSYGATMALRAMNLELYSGELLGFLGPNGAGKTTLIRCLAGRAKLDSGTIQFGEGMGRQGQLGFVPQTIALYEDLTAEQNLKVFGTLHSVPRSCLADRVEQALDWANLVDRRRSLVKTFSGGMQRRLNIACSILHRPKILLLDEPTVGVDPQSRERIYEMLRDLRAEGTAILLTTHQLDELQTRCDRIAIVDQGQVVRVGTFDELLRETVGHGQRLRIRFRETTTALPAPLQLEPVGDTGTCVIEDAPRELPKLLNRLHGDGLTVEHFVMQQPTLQDVFLHLTGKELRE